MSGARLKAVWWQPPDGEQFFAGWYDSKLDVECEVEDQEAFPRRCIPVGVRVQTQSSRAEFFRDVKCSQPLFDSGSDGSDTRFLILEDEGICARKRVFKPGKRANLDR